MFDAKTGLYELVLDESVRAEDNIPYQSLRNALEDPAITEIVLVFIGLKHMVEDSVLLLASLLQSRRRGVTLTSKVLSSLATPDLTLYVMSDCRLVLNPHAHFHFRLPNRTCSLEEELAEIFPSSQENRPSFRDADRKSINGILNDYVELESVSGKLLSVTDMSELGLVDGNSIDLVLMSCMAD